MCLCMLGCQMPDPNATESQKIGNKIINTYVIDGCEYIGDLNKDSRGYYLAHKGNCKNPIHKNQ